MAKKSKIENKFKDYKICVICSTQNQMVNYIPLSMKKFNFETIYNITITGSAYFKNSDWDKNLKKVLGREFIDIELEQSDTYSVSQIEKKFLGNENFKKLVNLEDKICWNITGGQRTILLAINKIICAERSKYGDIICYLEGNSNQIYTSDINYSNTKIINYNKEKFDLSITKALQLGGFKISEAKGAENLLDNALLEKFISIYKTLDNGLRDLLIDSNTDATQQQILDSLKKLNILDKEEDIVKSVIKWGFDKNKSTPFGYILEEMTRYQVEKLGNKIQEIKTNVRLYNEEKIEDINNTQIDEFDVLALTKNGKLIVFECKSGSMHPDIAKSTKYSTYAISGVYGLPILITPLLKKEIPPSSDFKKLGDKYDTIKASVASAIRAGLEVWGLDDIENRLKKYIKL